MRPLNKNWRISNMCRLVISSMISSYYDTIVVLLASVGLDLLILILISWFKFIFRLFYPQEDKELMKMVNELIVYCNNEIYDMDLCFECYERKCTNPDNLMLGLCKVPHLALWVKHDEFPYWPAKLLNSVHSDKVEVVFFSQCDTALVPSKNCLLFSVENPNDTDGSYAKEIADSYKVSLSFSDSYRNFFWKNKN